MVSLKKYASKGIDRLMVLCFVFLLLYFLYLYFEQDVLVFLQNNPWISEYYHYFYGEISSGSFVGIFYISFMSTLFFLFIPIEGVFISYIMAGVSPTIIIGSYFLGSFCGVSINYWIGYFTGKWGLEKVLKGNHETYQGHVKKLGGSMVFFSNLLPLPEALNVVYGGFRYPFFKFIAIAMLGKMLKCCAIVFGKDFVVDYVNGVTDRV